MTCPECPNPLKPKPTGRPPKYCSEKCQRKAERRDARTKYQRERRAARRLPGVPGMSAEQRACRIAVGLPV